MSGKHSTLVAITLVSGWLFLATTAHSQVLRRETTVRSSRHADVGFVPKHAKTRARSKPAYSAVKPVSRRPVKQKKTDPVANNVIAPTAHVIADGSSIDGAFVGEGCSDCSAFSECSACSGRMAWDGPIAYGRVEYLLWSTRGMRTPPLVTTSPSGTDREIAGVLGQPATTTLFGDSKINDELRSGGRFALGLWADASRCAGIEFTYILLEEENENYRASNFDESIVARPFFNLSLNQEDSRLIAFPSLVDGNTTVVTATEFQSMDLLRRTPYLRGCGWRADHLIGFRYAELKDSIRITESTISLAEPTTGTSFSLLDQFKTNSEFFGGVLGMRAEKQYSPCWSLEFMSKFALGNTRSRLAINGATTTTVDNTSSTIRGGLLTQGSNIGTVEDDEFSTLSEISLALKHRLPCGLICSVGYNFMYWSDVLRAGSQIDPVVNPTQIPPGQLVGEARPQVNLDYDSLYIQGLQLGFEIAY